MQKGFKSININGTANSIIPVPVIGENGNWFIGNDDTGIKAQGSKGDPGPKGDTGPQGPKGQDADMTEFMKLKQRVDALSNDLAKIKIININLGNVGANTPENVKKNWDALPTDVVFIGDFSDDNKNFIIGRKNTEAFGQVLILKYCRASSSTTALSYLVCQEGKFSTYNITG